MCVCMSLWVCAAACVCVCVCVWACECVQLPVCACECVQLLVCACVPVHSLIWDRECESHTAMPGGSVHFSEQHLSNCAVSGEKQAFF